MKYLSYSNELEGKANRVCKMFMKQICEQFKCLSNVEVDPQVYSINTVFRMPFTIHDKKGRLKTIVGRNMNKEDSNKFIMYPNSIEMFESEWEDMIYPNHDDIKPHWVLDESMLEESIPTEVKFKKYFPCPYGEKACIYSLFNTRLKKGEHRHNYAMRIVSYWKNDKELPDSWVWTLLNQWNEDCLEDPLNTKELEHVFRSINTYNYNLCNDDLMNKFCVKNNQCQSWVLKDMKSASSCTIIDAIREDKELRDDTSDPFNLSDVFKGMDCVIKPSSGKALSIVADKKVGKTMLAILIALKCKKPTVFFSAEIPKTGVISTLAAMLNLNPHDPLDAKAFFDATKHIFIIDKDIPALQNIPMAIRKIESDHKVKISMVLYDYLQLMQVLDENQYDEAQIGASWIKARKEKSLTERMDILARLIPKFAKTYGWLFVIPTQPTKGVGQEGRGILLPDSGKGGQSVSALFDYIITAWRPFKNMNKEEKSDNDNVMSLWLCANRWGEEDIIRNYEYYGNRRLVGKPYKGYIKQLEPLQIKD